MSRAQLARQQSPESPCSSRHPPAAGLRSAPAETAPGTSNSRGSAETRHRCPEIVTDFAGAQIGRQHPQRNPHLFEAVTPSTAAPGTASSARSPRTPCGRGSSARRRRSASRSRRGRSPPGDAPLAYAAATIEPALTPVMQWIGMPLPFEDVQHSGVRDAPRRSRRRAPVRFWAAPVDAPDAMGGTASRDKRRRAEKKLLTGRVQLS